MNKTINAGRVTFVPKDNFSNNISYKKFDIVTYNGSSYFAKKDTIGHIPTEDEFWQLVAEKGQNGAPGAVKMQVVDTLPETGETDTIYLVKKDNPGEQNLYDEYVYTDTGWEHIGDTSVDLSNYYTKEESDEKLLTKQDKLVAGDNITISEDNIISALAGSNYPIYQMIARWDNLSISGSSSSTITTDETIVNILNNFLTNVANQDNQIGTLTLMNVPSNFNSFSTNYIGISNIIQFNQTLTRFTLCLNIYCFGAEGRYNYRRIGAFHKLSGNGKWENNSFSITSLSLSKDSGDSTGKMSFTSATEEKVDREYLKKTNTSSYTPTGDYNPATKKYVDDQVGNINTVLATLTTVSEVTK